MSEYHKAYDFQRRGNKMFEVKSTFGLTGDWQQLLSCGHCVSAPTWANRKAKRRRCPVCAPVLRVVP